MGKIKTYWDVIKDEECHFYGGSSGWEVHLKWETYWDYTKSRLGKGEPEKKRKLALQWPWSWDQKLPKGEKAQTRKDVLLQKKVRKLLAKASASSSEFRELNERTYNMSQDDWDELFQTGLKGFDLRNYIQRTKLTDGEAHSLFWRM